MRIEEVLNAENEGKFYRCEHNNDVYKVDRIGTTLTLINDRGHHIGYTLALETLVKSEYTEIK